MPTARHDLVVYGATSRGGALCCAATSAVPFVVVGAAAYLVLGLETGQWVHGFSDQKLQLHTRVGAESSIGVRCTIAWPGGGGEGSKRRKLSALLKAAAPLSSSQLNLLSCSLRGPTLDTMPTML